MWPFRKKAEERSNVQNPQVPVSAEDFLAYFGIESSSVNVTLETALEVPAVWAAVNFLSGTIAGLPLNVFRRTEEGRNKVDGDLQYIFHDAVNDYMSSFEWRKYSFERVLTGGRSITLIKKDVAGRVTGLFPLMPKYVTVSGHVGARKKYVYKPEGQTPKTYYSEEIIDIPFMLADDGIKSKSPITTNKESIGLAIAATKYGSKFFNDGGVPPFVITGPFNTQKGMRRASEDLQKAVSEANQEKRLAISLPSGHEVKTLGVDPEKSQLVELKKYCNEEVARIYSLPVIFIQDLSKGTFNNTEQQDLHLVKHTIKRWVEQVEQELNLKIFGKNREYFIEFNLDGLMRGDFKTRMDGYARAIQNAISTPNEIRRRENMPDAKGGDRLLIQGATVPISEKEADDSALQDETFDGGNT